MSDAAVPTASSVWPTPVSPISTFSRVSQRFTVLVLCSIATVSSVAAQTVARLTVAPAALVLQPRVSRTVFAEVLDESDNVIPANRAGLLYSSSDTSVVQVSATGTAVAMRVGTAEIIVRAGALTRRVPVTVSVDGAGALPLARDSATATPPSEAVATGPTVIGATIDPATILLLPSERLKPTLKLRFADGTNADASQVIWNTFGTSIGFDSGTGDVIGVVPGSGVLGGRYGAVTASATVTVGEVNLVPDHDSVLLVAGALDTVRLLVASQGRRFVTQNLVWRTTDPAVLRVLSPSAGVVQARDAGTADLIVDGYTVTRRIPVRVSAKIARMETAIPAGTVVALASGGAAVIDARPIGTAGTALTSVTLRYTSRDTTIAQVDSRGAVLGIRAGTTEITLEAPGVEPLKWPVTVATAEVKLGSQRFSMQAGFLKPMQADLRGTDGKEFGRAAAPVWSSSAPQVAAVDGSGNVSARRPGRAVITVTQPGAGSDSSVVFVTGRVLVAGTMQSAGGVWQLMAPADTVAVKVIPADSGALSQAVWSPDRTRIAVTVTPDDKTRLPVVMIMDADGANRQLVGPSLVESSDPAWTRDGSALLFTTRTGKASALVRVSAAGGKLDTLVQVADGRFRSPVPGSDTSDVYVRLDKGGAMDVGRVRGGSLQMLTSSRPREELLAGLRDGRLLLSVDSSARSRPGTLLMSTVTGDELANATRIPLPAGLTLVDISAGPDENTVLVVGRAKTWPDASGPVLVLLSISFDGATTKTLMVLPDKDAITVRSD
jgi:hypothetical protein